jgi:NAD(P)-dependent dehydrogenase (short-subunit alcohol dehydrogenase family)
LPETLHGLAYCPGTITLKPFARLTSAGFLNDLGINLLGAARTIQSAIPALKKSEGASAVLFSTVAARTSLNFHASIASAKAAVEGLTVSLAAEYASTNIRFNVIAPSITQTPLAQQLLSNEQKVGDSKVLCKPRIIYGNKLYVAGARLAKKNLIVVTNQEPAKALEIYRLRWKKNIICRFEKTRI